MSISRKQLREDVKAIYVKKIWDYLKNEDEEVLRVASNEIAFPVIDAQGNEDFVVILVKIPTGSDGGRTPYDGYAMQQEYEMKQETKRIKAEETQKRKQEKIKRDEEYRRKKAEQKT